MKSPQVRSMRAVVFALALAVLFPTHAFAQRVLIIVAEDPGSQADFVNDVKGKLDATGRLEQVDVFDAHTGTPSLAQLLAYDSVMTWPNDVYQDRVALGNVLADYVDLGHGVVQTMFSFDPDVAGVRLGGRWETGGYQVFQNGPTSLDNLTLIADIASHPILDGVSNVALSLGFFETGMQTASCAEVVAHWSSGDPLVAWCPGPQAGRVVALNMYPPSSDVFPFAWDATTQGGLLMANTLLFAGTAPAATNHPPTVNAGLDQTLEATGPLGVAFSVTGTASDPDGDTLTLAWTGTGLVGDHLTFSGTLLPPVGTTSVSYTLTLTASDNHGGLASDDVVITVTDTTGPVLANVPAAMLTATATSDAGANVSYGPVTAADLVDGARPVVCSKAPGLFPVGDTVVTCTSTDTRGNSSSRSFTVRVTDVTTPGLMVGDGLVRSGGVNYEFEFVVRERGSERGALQVRVTNVQNSGRNRRDDRFYARTTDFVAFSDDPTVRPGRSRRPQVDTVLFSGMGEWNGRSGYRYEVFGVDQGDAYHRHDTVRITIKAPNGSVVACADGTLTNGFVESARLRR